ncbi:UNVERIFIED_CONTAM: hypothetical protein PYX00_011099 [Menopon gallinae]|uniref:3-oxoacyl-[acyl-carrier-protein] synthase n=1 Tax=Menopon gallinae TaxID=328185 RepID=A0AAW2H5Y0_9NEOP
MGVVSPLGLGNDHIWNRLINGESGISKITCFDVSDLPSQVAGQVPLGSYSENKFNIEDWMPLKEARRNDKFILYAVAAAEQAINDSNLTSLTNEQKERVGVNIGSGIGGLATIYDTSVLLEKGEYKKISPFFIPAALINLAPGLVSIRHGFMGPNISITTACATGAHSIGDSFWYIKNNQADIMVAGGAEAAVCKLGLAGFGRMSALSTNFNNDPTKASRPWDNDRDGFVIAEGAGVLVLEELEHAKKRGAKIYAELVGYGCSGDASHITAPSGNGAVLCMKNALQCANISPEEVDYVNAHGTSTPLGDKIEAQAIEKVFNNNKDLMVSSTKSSTGHLLGAAGAFEAIVSIQTCVHDIVPPTLNLDNPIEDIKLDLVPHKAKEKKVNYALSNSFGFGGTNAALIFKKANF